MEDFVAAWRYALANLPQFQDRLGRHLVLVGASMAIAMLLCLPAGILSSRSRWLSAAAINTFNTLRVMPSLAVLFIFIAIPGFGLSIRSAIVALTLLACPPIIINTTAAFRGIDRAIREAAFGMGMSPPRSCGASSCRWRSR